MRRPTKSRAAQLERDITEILTRGHRKSSRGRHHATMRECVTWPVDEPIAPLLEAKRQTAAEFERCYLINLMERTNGSVSEAARKAKIDRSNFKKLLNRHGLRAKSE